MANRTFHFIATVAEVKTYAVTIRAPSERDALIKAGQRVDDTKHHLRGFKLRSTVSRTITAIRDGK